MINVYCEELYDRLQEELQLVEEIGQPAVRRLSLALNTVTAYLKLLRSRVEEAGFESVEEEIDFFKVQKPRFYRWLIYYQECFAIESHVPPEPGQLRVDYYREQFRYLDHFFRQHEFQYQYYRLGAVELDRVYFVRGVQAEQVLAPVLPEVDPVFNTVQDYLFAKFMAYELVRDWLVGMMAPAEGPAEGFTSKKGKVLKWTGDTCNLIEVAYGFYDTSQINDGEVDLTDIIDWLEVSLNVNLSRFYRRFMEIKRRKSMSKTRYLDAMREAVNKRIEDTDALQTEKRRSFRNR